MTPVEYTAIIVAAIAAGLLTWFRDIARYLVARRNGKTPGALQSAHVVTVDQSLAVVARARDELEADNARLRQQSDEDRARYDADRARWELREAAMRDEIDALSRKLRALLIEVEQMKDRHTYDEVERRRMYPGAFPNS